MVQGDGQLVTISKEHTPDFQSYLINFGGLGVIVNMTMKVQQTFMSMKSIYTDLMWDEMFKEENFHKIMNYGDIMSFFCTYRERKMTSVWVGQHYAVGEKVPEVGQEFFGAKHITTPRLHPCPGQPADACVYPGPGFWKDKIYHFLPDRPPSSNGDEIQTEYFVPYDNLREALEILYTNREKFMHLVQVTEIR